MIRFSRWTWLSLLAIANLMFWVTLAAVVSGLSGDAVDVGVETFLRVQQATAVAYFEDPPLIRPRTARPTEVAAGLLEDEASPIAALSGQIATGVAVATPASGLLPAPADAAGPQRVDQPSGGRETAGGVQQAASQTGAPLALSNPRFDRLMKPDGKMALAEAGREVTIRYEEEALNREIDALLAAVDDVAYRDVTVDLKDGQVIVTGNVTALGIKVHARIEGQLLVEDCAPHLAIETLSVGGFMTPRLIQDRASEIVVRALDWYPPDSPVCLSRIVVEDGAVTAYGLRR